MASSLLEAQSRLVGFLMGPRQYWASKGATGSQLDGEPVRQLLSDREVGPDEVTGS